MINSHVGSPNARHLSYWLLSPVLFRQLRPPFTFETTLDIGQTFRHHLQRQLGQPSTPATMSWDLKHLIGNRHNFFPSLEKDKKLAPMALRNSAQKLTIITRHLENASKQMSWGKLGL